MVRLAPALVALVCLAGAPLAAADTPAPAPAPAAPAAPTELGGQPQPAVNQSFLEKATAAAGLLAQASEATGVTGKLTARFGGGGSSAGTDDKVKLATGLKTDLQSLHDGKKVASDGAFSQLVLSGKDAIATKFKGVKGADTVQAAFADDGIGKALVAATPVDKVPGYQKSVDALTSLTPAK